METNIYAEKKNKHKKVGKFENLAGRRIYWEQGRYQPIDVRSPGEYRQAHIPIAVNVPLFTDEERAVIGNTYKKKG